MRKDGNEIKSELFSVKDDELYYEGKMVAPFVPVVCEPVIKDSSKVSLKNGKYNYKLKCRVQGYTELPEITVANFNFRFSDYWWQCNDEGLTSTLNNN